MCGLASSAILLNSLVTHAPPEGRTEWDEDLVLSSQRAIDVSKVLRGGLTLDEIVLVLESIGVRAEAARATHTDDGAVRDALLGNLISGLPTILNYHMSTAGQTPYGGHFSPVPFLHLQITVCAEPPPVHAGHAHPITSPPRGTPCRGTSVPHGWPSAHATCSTCLMSTIAWLAAGCCIRCIL